MTWIHLDLAKCNVCENEYELRKAGQKIGGGRS